MNPIYLNKHCFHIFFFSELIKKNCNILIWRKCLLKVRFKKVLVTKSLFSIELHFLTQNVNELFECVWRFCWVGTNTVNKSTWLTKNTATAIDHIITNSLLHRTINTGITKLGISDIFPMFLIAETEKRMAPAGKVQITNV